MTQPGCIAVDTREPEDLQLPYLVTFSKAAELSNFSGAAKAHRLTVGDSRLIFELQGR